MFSGGITAAALGLLALSSALQQVGQAAARRRAAAQGRWLRGVSIALVAGGPRRASGTSRSDLTGTARLTAAGFGTSPRGTTRMPAYRLVRPPPRTAPRPAGFAVCLHPAFGTYLHGCRGGARPGGRRDCGSCRAHPVRAEQVPYAPPFYSIFPSPGSPRVRVHRDHHLGEPGGRQGGNGLSISNRSASPGSEVSSNSGSPARSTGLTIAPPAPRPRRHHAHSDRQRPQGILACWRGDPERREQCEQYHYPSGSSGLAELQRGRPRPASWSVSLGRPQGRPPAFDFDGIATSRVASG